MAQPFAGPAAKLGGDGPQPLPQSDAGAYVALTQPGDLLDEGRPPAPGAVAEEAPHSKAHRQLPSSKRLFCQRPPVGEVSPSPQASAARATGRMRQPHQHDLWTSSQPFQFDIDSGEQNIFDRAESHAHVIPQGNDLACMPLTWDFTELRSESKFEIGISGHGGLYGALAQGRVDADRVH
ncbi:hypothetical protein AB0K23_39785 [Streptomyces sp. NPDC049602]|uniref:hypothetical protein n=1 Tax=Streptomyces sp. NPDC049602 TaxID=3155504 RepID=UPI00341A8CA2